MPDACHTVFTKKIPTLYCLIQSPAISKHNNVISLLIHYLLGGLSPQANYTGRATAVFTHTYIEKTPKFGFTSLYSHVQHIHKTNTNSVALVRERTIPTERQHLVGEVSANFCGQRVSRGQCNGPQRPYSRLLERSHYFFFQAAPQLYSRG
jgi:hypothetical protein